MDTLTFITKILETVAWPLISLIIVSIFRKEIKLLLSYITKLKAGPVEAEFEGGVRAIASRIETTAPQFQNDPLAPKPQTLIESTDLDGRTAILEAWLDIESTIKRLQLERALNQGPKRTASQNAIVQSFITSGVLNKEDIALYNELRGLRNLAVHQINFSPSREAVMNYIKLSNRLMASLERGTSLQAG